MTDDFNKDFENHKAVWESMYGSMRPVEKKGSPSDELFTLDNETRAALERELKAAVEAERWVAQTAQAVGAREPKRRWWQHEQFPLLPVWRYSPADEWNEANIHFQWLLFTIFTMPMPDLEVKFELTATALQLVIQALYVRLMIYIPFPHAVERFVYNRLGRYPRKW